MMEKEKYVCPKGEEHLYHVLQEVVRYNEATGERINPSRVQKYGRKAFEHFIADQLRQQGYTIVILHDPNEYDKEQAMISEEKRLEKEEQENLLKKEREEAKKKEEEARMEEIKRVAKEEAKAEILAELKEQGIIPENGKKATAKK